MHIRGSIQVQKDLQLLNPGGSTPADGLIALSDAKGNLRWSHLTLPTLVLNTAYPNPGTLVTYQNKVYYSLIPNAEADHLVDPTVWRELTASVPAGSALTQDQKDAIAASKDPSAGNAFVTKKEVQNLIIKGSETVASILAKSPLSINNLWLATTAGFDSFGKAVLAGDGLTSTGTEWINIGAIRGPASFPDAIQNGIVYARKNGEWQEVIHQDITGKEDRANKGIAFGYVPLNGVSKVAAEFLSLVNDLTTGGTSVMLTAEQGKVLKQQIDAINVLLASDDVNLNTVQELVDALKKVPTILVDDLITGGATKALTAQQGVVLKALIDNLPTPSLQAVVTVAGSLTDKIITSTNTLGDIGYSEIHANKIIFTDSSVLANQVSTSVLTKAGLTIKNTVSKTETTINSTGLVISTLSDLSGYGSTVTLKRHSDMPLESNIAIVLQAPNKLTGTYILATTIDIPFEMVDEGKGDGFIIRGRTPANYGAIGDSAFDLTYSTTVSALLGATGSSSFSTGYQNIASGYGAVVFGAHNISNGTISLVTGIYQNEAAGYGNVLFGIGHSVTNGAYATVVGQFANVVTNNIYNVNDPNNTMLAVGNGSANGAGSLQSRSTAFLVKQSGSVTAPSLTTAMIAGDATGKMLVTKEYLATLASSTSTGTNTGDQDLSGKQNLLISGTNIRTLNGQSLLGVGDMTTPVPTIDQVLAVGGVASVDKTLSFSNGADEYCKINRDGFEVNGYDNSYNTKVTPLGLNLTRALFGVQHLVQIRYEQPVATLVTIKIPAPSTNGVYTLATTAAVHLLTDALEISKQNAVLSNNVEVASSSNEGKLRYYTSANGSYMDISMKTGATTYIWKNIVQNIW